MSIFKAALRVAWRHRLYFAIYLVAISVCSLPILFSGTGGGSGTHETYDASIAVIDRDGSVISQGLTEYLDAEANLVPLEDDSRSIQDALAQSQVDCVIVIPEGLGDDLMAAAHASGSDGSASGDESAGSASGDEASGDEASSAPSIEAAYGTVVQSGALAVSDASNWLSLVGRAAALDSSASQEDAVARANEASAEEATVNVAQVDAAQGGTDSFTSYLGFNTYSLFVAIVVCTGMVMTRFRREEVRRRGDASPKSPASFGSAVVGAGFVLATICWAWVSLLGIGFGQDALTSANALQVTVSLAAMFLYCLVPLALAFDLSQLNANEQSLNAVGNIFGLLSSFFSGAWVSLDLMGSAVAEFSKFTPGYWFNDVLSAAFASTSWSSMAGRVGTDIAMLALFVLVTAMIGVVISRLNTQRYVGAARLASAAK